MLSLVSMYLDVPLKYPLVPAMSKSAVIDPMVSEINPRDVTKLTQNRKMASSQALILDCQDLGALTKAISLLNEVLFILHFFFLCNCADKFDRINVFRI